MLLGLDVAASGEGPAASALTAPAMDMTEKARRRVVALVFVVFWILMFEGALRKWVAPQYSAYLFFLRDPVVIYAYIVALRSGLFGRPPLLLLVAVAIAVLAAVLSFAHLAAGGGQYTAILAIYGLRNYFLYVPLAFLIGQVFRYEDLSRIACFSMLAMIIAAPIAVLQFESSPTAVVNVGISTDQALQFDNLASGSGKVRPAGTFTSVVGMTQLTVSTIAFFLWAWTVSRKPPPVNPWLVRIAFVATAAALAVSGSRTTFVHSALVMAVGLSVAPFLAGASAKIRSFLVPVAVVVAFVLLFPLVFPEAFQTFTDRWIDAAATEGQRFEYGWIGRAFYSFYDFIRLLGEIPLAGYGMGMAGNGAVMMGVEFNGASVLRLAEEDWSRHVVELGPVLAVVFIAYRVCFGLWLAGRAACSTLASGDPLPVLLFAYVGVALVQGQITSHGLVNGFGWLYVGLCMAACNVLQSSSSQPLSQSSVATSASVVRYPNVMR